MSFQRDSTGARRWQHWLARHRAALVAAGLPDWVYANEARWQRFLGEGGLEEESGWQVEMLSPLQKNRLRAFLVREYGPEVIACCLRSLDNESRERS
jgi:hypothetical protein